MRRLFFPSQVPVGLTTTWLTKFEQVVRRRFKIPGGISISFVSVKEMQRLNCLYRQKHTPTDVLSFNLWPSDTKVVAPDQLFGEIILCYPVLQTQAKEKRHSRLREFQILTIHGVLHILGYDHEQDREAVVMEALERELLAEVEGNIGRSAKIQYT